MSEEKLELEVIVNDEPLLKEVTFNYEQLKADLENKLEKYNNLEVTEKSMKDAKHDKARLNELDDVLMKKGQEIDNKILGLFKERLKELRGLVKGASNSIKAKVDELEQKEKDCKKGIIETYYQENIDNLKDVLPFDSIFNPKWLNKGATPKSIEAELKQIIDTVRKDLSVIDTLDSEFKLQVKDYYLRYRDFSGAMAEESRLKDQKKKIEAAEKPLADGGIVTKECAEILKPEKSEVDDLDWANTSKKPKETSIKIICNDSQLELLKKFLNTHNIKFEEVN